MKDRIGHHYKFIVKCDTNDQQANEQLTKTYGSLA